MLPRRIPKKSKRATRWRSQAHCSFVRSHECCVPGCNKKPIEVAHIRTGSGAGVGQKPDDWFTISLCREHHAEQHQVGEQTFARARGVQIHTLADEFAKASPKAREIAAAKAERANV